MRESELLAGYGVTDRDVERAATAADVEREKIPEPEVVRRQQDEATARRFARHLRYRGDCWLWAGSKTTNGYGIFFDGQAKHIARRYAFEHRYRPLLPGELLAAAEGCQRHCVNPEHMLVTNRGAMMARNRLATAEAPTGRRAEFRRRRAEAVSTGIPHRPDPEP